MRSIMRGAFGAAFFAAFLGASSGANAVNTQNVGVCDPATPQNCLKPQNDGSINVNGSFSATLAGFTPNGNVASLSVTTSSANVALPAGLVVAVTNSGGNDAHIVLSVGPGTATTSSFILKAGATVGLTVGSNTYINAITDTSTSTLSIAGGTGLVTGYGGSSGGGAASTVSISQTTPGTTNGVVVNSSALPTGAATAAKQPALGTAGSPSSDVLTVQGSGSGTALPVSAGSLPLPSGASTSANQSTANASLGTIVTNTTGLATASAQTTANGSLSTIATNSGTQATAANQTAVTGSKSGGTAATSSLLAGGVYNSSAPTLTTGQQAALQLDANGNAKVAIVSGGGTGGTASSFSSAFPATGTAIGVTNGTNMVPLNADGSGNLKVVGVGVAQGSTTSGQSVSPIGCRTLSSAPTDTTAQTNMPRCMTDGSLAMTIVSGGGTGGTSSSFASAFPSTGTAIGAQNSSGMGGLISCDASVVYDASTSGSTQLVALSSGKKVYICGYSLFAAGTVNVELDYGTGTACATSPTKIVPAYQLTTQTGFSDQSPFYRGLSTAASNALCIKTSAGVAVQAIVYYTQF